MKGEPDSNLALKIDIFGIGMIFYHLVFGEYPYKNIMPMIFTDIKNPYEEGHGPIEFNLNSKTISKDL